MPEITPTGAVDVVQRQVRCVRRRKNLYELQRACYLTIAAAGAAATVLLPVALLASTDVFTIAVWSALVIVAGLGLVIVGGLRRRWLARAHALAWIEGRSALGGRVRTLVELASRPGSASAFHALLVEQIGRNLDAWTPRRLVPRLIPRLPFASAFVTLLMLAGALRLASLSLPSAPTITFSHRPVGGTAEAPAPENAPPGERIVVVPGVPEERGNAPTSAGADRDATDSTLTQLSSALQESVRRQVWGEAWERVRDALARAATSREGAPAGELEEDLETASTDDWEMASAPSGDLGRRRRPGVARHPSTRAEDPAPTDASADAAAEQEAEQEKKDAGAGRSGGAGNGTDPNVFGGPRVQRDDGAGSFELSLAARMRTDQGRGEASGGPPPVAAPDARPALAAQQRRESAAHRMTVPAAYEAVVREVFAHRKQP